MVGRNLWTIYHCTDDRKGAGETMTINQAWILWSITNELTDAIGISPLPTRDFIELIE